MTSHLLRFVGLGRPVGPWGTVDIYLGETVSGALHLLSKLPIGKVTWCLSSAFVLVALGVLRWGPHEDASLFLGIVLGLFSIAHAFLVWAAEPRTTSDLPKWVSVLVFLVLFYVLGCVVMQLSGQVKGDRAASILFIMTTFTTSLLAMINPPHRMNPRPAAPAATQSLTDAGLDLP